MGRVQEEKLKEKKLIRAPEDLVDKLNEASARQGKTFYKYVTEIFEQALEAENMNKTLISIIESYKLSEISRKTGVAMVPKDFLNMSLNQIYENNEQDFQHIWYQTGKLYGFLLKGKFDDEIGALIRLLKENLLIVNEVERKKIEKYTILRFIAPSISAERSKLLLYFIEGVLASLECQIIEENNYKGIIDIKISQIS
jgi:hypothetical protein